MSINRMAMSPALSRTITTNGVISPLAEVPASVVIVQNKENINHNFSAQKDVVKKKNKSLRNIILTTLVLFTAAMFMPKLRNSKVFKEVEAAGWDKTKKFGENFKSIFATTADFIGEKQAEFVSWTRDLWQSCLKKAGTLKDKFSKSDKVAQKADDIAESTVENVARAVTESAADAL